MAELTNEERAELKARSSLITMYRQTAALLESEQRSYLRHLLVSKGLDPAKRFAVNPETGELTEEE